MGTEAEKLESRRDINFDIMKKKNRNWIYSLALMLVLVINSQLLLPQSKSSINVTNELFKYILKDYHLTDEGKAEIKNEPASKYISVKSVDLNGDGIPEYIVEGLKPPLMGMLAGYVWIYKKTAKSYYLIGDIGSFENVTPIKTKHNGYMDIQVTITLMAGQRKEISKFVFNGSKYEYKD